MHYIIIMLLIFIQPTAKRLDAFVPLVAFSQLIILFLLNVQINAHYNLHPYFNIYMHQIIKGLWRRSYPRKDSCGIGTHKVEIQPTIDLVEYGGLWPACGGGKSRGYRRDDGCGFLFPSPIGFHYHRDTYLS